MIHYAFSVLQRQRELMEMKSEKNSRGKRLSREKEALYGLQRKILSLIVFAAIAAVSLVVIRGDPAG